MATARHLHLNDNPSPNIDVYTTPVVVYAGETFNWTISGQDRQSGVSVTPDTIWPFVQTSFGVSLGGNGTPATVLDMPGEYQFQCTPAAPTTPQTMIVAKVYGLCSVIQAPQGGYFAWQNTGNGAIVVNVKRGYGWPLVQSHPIVIQPNTTVIVQVLPSVLLGDYPIDVTMQQGGSAVCAELTTPKIIVTAPEPGPKSKHSY